MIGRRRAERRAWLPDEAPSLPVDTQADRRAVIEAVEGVGAKIAAARENEIGWKVGFGDGWRGRAGQAVGEADYIRGYLEGIKAGQQARRQTP